MLIGFLSKYKGHQGSIHFDAKTNTFYGKVLCFPEITYKGKDIKELHSNFRKAIDNNINYIENHSWIPM